MADIDIIIWNIRFFSLSHYTVNGNATRLVDAVHPIGGRLCDIFIIIEPKIAANQAVANVGQVMTGGSGVKALQSLFYALHNRDGNWRLVPPRAMTTASTKEMVAYYYHAGAVALVGLDNAPAYAAPVVLPAVNNALTEHGLVAVPGHSAWAASPVGPPLPIPATLGRIRFSPNANPVANGNEVVFPTAGQRRPYMARFRDLVSANEFNIVAHHAAPDSDHPDNVNGIDRMSRIREITSHRTAPSMIVGDYNCCTMPNAGTHANHHGNERTALQPLVGQNGHRYKYPLEAIRILRAAADATDQFQLVVAAGNNVGAFALVNAIAVPVNNAAVAAALIVTREAQAIPPPLDALATTAANDATAAGLVVYSNNPLTLVGEAIAARALARNALDAVLALVAHLEVTYAPSPFILNAAIATRRTAEAYDEEPISKVNAVTATRAVGAAVRNACAAVNMVTPTFATRTTAGPLATTAVNVTNMTASCAGAAVAARDAVLAIEPALFKTHLINKLSSLQLDTGATPGPPAANYCAHAFDHIVTVGFIDVKDADVVDLIAANTVGVVNTNAFRAIFRRYHKPNHVGQQGLSDHLPVKVTVTL